MTQILAATQIPAANRIFTALLGVLAFLLPAAAAQQDKADAKLYLRREGETVRAAIAINIDRGWHLYHDELGPEDAVGKPTVVTFSGEGLEWSNARFPKPKRLEQRGLGADGGDTWIYGHEGRITLHALGKAEAGADLSSVRAEIDGLTCEDNGSCIPYFQELSGSGEGADELFASFPSDLTIEAPGEGGPKGSVESPDGAPTGSAGEQDYSAVEFGPFTPRAEKERERSLWRWLLLALVAGAILNVMPCVLPVISIKVLSFVQQAGEERGRVLALGLSFAAGILVVFEALAILAITLGQSWGEQFQSQTFLIVMIGIIFAFSLSLFGVYELGVPRGVGALAGLSREGLGDAFMKGVMATLLATPCSGPFLGSTLAWTLQQTPLMIFAVFTALGLGMALPYVVLTANPALLRILPKPGAWMETFKQAMGFVLLGTVIYLMISLKQSLLLFTAAFLVFVALGCWWWGRFAKLDQSAPVRFAHLLIAFAITGLGARVAYADFQGLFTSSSSHLAWEDFDPQAFQRYSEEGRNMMIDFTAEWCPNCKYNERFVYESEEVRAKLADKNVVAIRADITHNTPYTRMLERLMNQLGTRSIPFLAIFPAGEPDKPHTRFDVVTVKDIAALIASLPDPEDAKIALTE
jgi:thiol:disulfide interchange protein DsbD